jgi:hypothetical protein
VKTLEIQGFHDSAVFADFSENRHFFSARTDFKKGIWSMEIHQQA